MPALQPCQAAALPALQPCSRAALLALLARYKLVEKIESHENQNFYLFKILRAHILPLTNCAFNKSGDRFITGSYDRTCKVWNTLTGEELLTLEGHKNVVYAIAFNNPSRSKSYRAAPPLRHAAPRSATQATQRIMHSTAGAAAKQHARTCTQLQADRTWAKLSCRLL